MVAVAAVACTVGTSGVQRVGCGLPRASAGDRTGGVPPPPPHHPAALLQVSTLRRGPAVARQVGSVRAVGIPAATLRWFVGLVSWAAETRNTGTLRYLVVPMGSCRRASARCWASHRRCYLGRHAVCYFHPPLYSPTTISTSVVVESGIFGHASSRGLVPLLDVEVTRRATIWAVSRAFSGLQRLLVPVTRACFSRGFFLLERRHE